MYKVLVQSFMQNLCINPIYLTCMNAVKRSGVLKLILCRATYFIHFSKRGFIKSDQWFL